MSHSFAVLSLPVTTVLPSELNAAARTKLPCPLSVARHAPLAASHSFAVLSKLPVTTVLPSGLNAAAHTVSLCPRSVARHAPLAASHSFAVLSDISPDISPKP